MYTFAKFTSFFERQRSLFPLSVSEEKERERHILKGIMIYLRITS